MVALTFEPPCRWPLLPTGVPPTTETASPSPTLVLFGHSSPRPTSLAVSLQRLSAAVSTTEPLGKLIVDFSGGVYTSSEVSAVPWSSTLAGSMRLLVDAGLLTLLGLNVLFHVVPAWPLPATAI